jgi:hypothetical protein
MTLRDRFVYTMSALLLALAVAAPAGAQQAVQQPTPAPYDTQWWFTPGAVSRHFERQSEFNQTHPQFGFEYFWRPNTALIFGTYKNSNYLWSRYVGVNWTPLELGPIRLGATAQITNNYIAARDRKPFPFAAPMASFEYRRFGLNLYAVPTIRDVTGAVALQVKFRFD